jgi:hypothetical protein
MKHWFPSSKLGKQSGQTNPDRNNTQLFIFPRPFWKDWVKSLSPQFIHCIKKRRFRKLWCYINWRILSSWNSAISKACDPCWRVSVAKNGLKNQKSSSRHWKHTRNLNFRTICLGMTAGIIWAHIRIQFGLELKKKIRTTCPDESALTMFSGIRSVIPVN